MELTTIILLIAAVFPAVFFILYIDMIDSKKPEPWQMLLLAALVGAAMAFAVTKSGLPYLPEKFQITEHHSLLKCLTIGFLGVAIPAEIAKWCSLIIFSAMNKHYDEFLDGIVYSVCLAMGFVWIWSVWFMTEAIDASSFEMMEKCIYIIVILVPIHLASSTIMGYFFALAKCGNKFRNCVLALLLPTLITGVLCTLFFKLGNNWAFYIIAGVLLPILSLISYSQIFGLKKMDENKA
ncbi:MAG: PrsW family intramembrane metalloprotease [Bacteroidaceae bacterium]|nr:PrsW family intramembrane metalloprotease [Bacteroidaceae bacterium]